MISPNQKTVNLNNTLNLVIMNSDLLIGALRKGQSGSEILSILDALVGTVSDDQSRPQSNANWSLDDVSDFWYHEHEVTRSASTVIVDFGSDCGGFCVT